MAWLRHLFCKHTWRILARTRAPRQPVEIEGTSYDVRAGILAAQGSTQFLVTCDKCGGDRAACAGGSGVVKTIDDLIAASSLGDPEALAVRAGADPAVVKRVLARADGLTRIARGASALNKVFGTSWSDLNRETARRDEERAETYRIPCSRSDCENFACVTVVIDGVGELVCRHCAHKVLFK